MLIKRAQLDAIVRGEVKLAFRRWQRPTVKAGGTLKTAVGVLAIDAVDRVAMSSITKAEARTAGFDDREALLTELRKRAGSVYRVALHYQGDDPRIALRKEAKLSGTDRTELDDQLARYDKHSKLGPWTDRVLRCIAKNEGVRAPDQAVS